MRLSKLSYFVVIMLLMFSCTDGNNATKGKETKRKVSSSLHSVIEELQTETDKKQRVLTFIDKSVQVNERGEIQIYIQLYAIDESKLDELENNGVVIDINDSQQKLVLGWATPHQIKLISELPFVKSIDLPTNRVSN